MFIYTHTIKVQIIHYFKIKEVNIIKRQQLLVKSLLIALFLLILTDTASAGASIGLDDLQKEVLVGGTVDFTVILKSTYNGDGVLAWGTDDSAITATLNGGTMAMNGNIGVHTSPGQQSFTLTVAAGDGAVNGKTYNIQINYCYQLQENTVCERNIAKATAEADIIPTPELDIGIKKI
jgi:hypothetical protein